MQLTEAQLEHLAEEGFLDHIVDILAEEDATALAVLRSPEGRAMLHRQYRQAQSYGLATELELGRYLITAWLLGVDFDTRFPAMQEILASPSLSPAQKAEAIEQIARALLETLHRGAAR